MPCWPRNNSPMDKTFSHSALAGYVKKLHLVPGDILIVSHPEVLQQLQRMPAMGFNVPVVYSEDGKLSKASREQVLEILERIDESQAVAEGMT